ncbi:hypothetical protein [Halomicrobium salinisoli]|uniref:hypothetical protein n=1 Tax=Halomicrobium salinisoli TaxID=2878391 RepID=UPI001CF06613|nr:hypothetical protein [Halomicrobium salinisoli]
MDGSRRSLWLPDRPPTWLEVALAVLIAFEVWTEVGPGEPFSWPHAAVGFVVTLVAMGPGTESRVGKVIGQWFRRIGLLGRSVAILLYIVGVFVVFETVGAPPEAPTNGIVTGSLSAVALLIVVHVVSVREVDGWLPD